MKALLPLACVLAAAILVSGQTRAGEDHGEPIIEKKIKIVVAEDGGDAQAEVIRLDGDDLEPGESRQFLTDSGKEVVITRNDDESLTVTVDGKDIELPAVHDIDIDIDGADGNSMVFVKKIIGDMDLGEDADIEEVIVKKIGSGSSNMVFISEDGEAVKIEGKEGMAWSHHTGHGAPHIIKLKGDVGNAAERLKESGALDSLTEEQREEILKALESGAGSDGEHKVMVIEVDEEAHGDHDHNH